MSAEAFDIYQTAKGFVAVTNPTRRGILDALTRADADLGRLVKCTGKAKPTLSSVHMRALLADDLVAEYPHPTDARRKFFRLAARRIGMSSVPIEELRGALRHYTRDARGPSIPLGAALDIATCEGVPPHVLERQSRLVGEHAAGYVGPAEPHETMAHIANMLDQAGVARPQRLDFENLEVELEMLPRGPLPRPALAEAIVGFFEGVLRIAVDRAAIAEGRWSTEGRLVVTLTLGPKNVST